MTSPTSETVILIIIIIRVFHYTKDIAVDIIQLGKVKVDKISVLSLSGRWSLVALSREGGKWEVNSFIHGSLFLVHCDLTKFMTMTCFDRILFMVFSWCEWLTAWSQQQRRRRLQGGRRRERERGTLASSSSRVDFFRPLLLAYYYTRTYIN